MSAKTAAAYRAIRGGVEPFDVFLFSGKGFVSEAIRLATGSEFSHVATNLRLPGFDYNLLFESTTLGNLPDLLTGKPVKGVQLVYTAERLKTYDGEVAWLPIRGPKTPAMIDAALAFVREFQGRPYEKSQLDLVRAAIDLPGFDGGAEDASSVFCSELAALVWAAVCIAADDGVPADERTPGDFVAKIPLMPAYARGDLVHLDIG